MPLPFRPAQETWGIFAEWFVLFLNTFTLTDMQESCTGDDPPALEIFLPY